MSATTMTVALAEGEDARPLPCVVCHGAKTLNRCRTCGKCALCSDACCEVYRKLHGGNAACLYHRVSRKFKPTLAARFGECNVCDEDGFLGDFDAAPMALMGRLEHVEDGGAKAIYNSISFVRNVLNEQGEFAPITVHTSAVLSVAGTDNGALWSTGMLRTSWMPDPAPAVTSVQLTAEQHKHKQLSRLLAHASRLAVAQTWSLTAKSSSDSSRKRGHLFLIAGLVDLRGKLSRCSGEHKRPPDPESTDDPNDWSFGLQFDIVQLAKTLDPSLRNLSCTRSLPPDPNGRYRAGVAVFQLKSSLHAASGMPIFRFPKGKPRLLARDACGTLAPLCPWDVAMAALHVRQPPPADTATAPPA